ncbi:preprotein translocase SecA [Longispora fulva]|uniref:DUF5926 domain-containing protein n=1 Tax=Longispora fulva TaxID=619741 RepID=A0A8J7GL95_9ACTN|nr:DUF5926 family protein [Longispora fulva]MBG6139765.1 hypothetical protein [Longispora fulva]GIG57851.1 preprotein translocase SecA [Longispora fulva]
MSKRAKKAGEKRPKVRDIFVPRPFAGLPSEVEWVALRELVPAASAPLKLKPEFAVEGRDVILATVLPMAWPAMTKPDGRVFVALQRHVQSGDISRDIAVAILRGLETAPGQPVAVPALPGEGPRLQDILVDEPLDVTVHAGFEFWLDDDVNDPSVTAGVERANEAIYPTKALAAAEGAYWCQVVEKSHVRWVLGDDEDRGLDALSRLSASQQLLLGEGTKFAGMFRAHGTLVPVWDVPFDPPADDWEQPLAEFVKRYAEAYAVTADLSPAERQAKQGLQARQLTLR